MTYLSSSNKLAWALELLPVLGQTRGSSFSSSCGWGHVCDCTARTRCKRDTHWTNEQKLVFYSTQSKWHFKWQETQAWLWQKIWEKAWYTLAPAVVSSSSGWSLAAATVRYRGPLCCGTDYSHLSPRGSGLFWGIRGSVCTTLARKFTTHLVYNLPHYLIFELEK